jgi:hypothetical protein
MVAMLAILTLTTALVGVTVAPAAAASTLTATDASGGARSTFSYTVGNGSVKWTLKVCDIKADGHYAKGVMSFRGRDSILDNWGGLTTYVVTASGSGKCASVARISYYCDFWLEMTAGVFESDLLIANTGYAWREIFTC